VKSLEDLKSKLSKKLKASACEWIRFVNLNTNAFPECQGRGITRGDIDGCTGDHPAILQDWSAHGALANSLALDLSGLDRNTPDPAGGHLVRDNKGELTGFLQELSATFLVFRNVPLWTDEELTASILSIQTILNSEGYTGFTESTLGPANNLREYGAAGERGIFLYKKLADEGKLTTRVAIGFYSGVDGIQSSAFLKHDLESFKFPETADPLWFKLNMVKIFCDGVHIFHSSWMLEDYIDTPGNHGRSCLGGDSASEKEQAEELRRMIEIAHRHGYQVGIHAIGDRAVEETMNAIIDGRQNYPGKNPRHYIIRGIARNEQAKKAARYTSVSVQPAIADHAFEPPLELIGARRPASLI
jgi:predicted amidohydrolase YtcJ